MSSKSERVTQITPVWFREEARVPPEKMKNVIDLAATLYSNTKWEGTNLSRHRILLIPLSEQRLIGIGWSNSSTQLVVQTWKTPENGENKSLIPEEAIARRSSVYDFPSPPAYFRTEGADTDWLSEVETALQQADMES